MFLFVAAFGSAQNQSADFQIEWGSVEKFSKRELYAFIKIIGTDDNYLYAYHPEVKDPQKEIETDELFKCNLKTGAIDKVEFDLEGRKFEYATYWNDKIYLFSSFQNKKHKKHYLFVQTVDKNTLRPNPDIVKIAELEYEKEGKRRSIAFNYAFSPDSSQLLISYTLADMYSEILYSGFDVFNKDFNRMWGNDNVTTGVEGNFSFQESAIDNSGNVFFTGKIVNKRATGTWNMFFSSEEKVEGPSEEELSNKYYIIAYLKDQNFPVPINIQLPEKKYPITAKIAFSPQLEIFCVGLYSQIGMKNAVGIFSAKIKAAEMKVSDTKLKPFDYTLLSKGMNKEETEQLQKSINEGEDYENAVIYELSENKEYKDDRVFQYDLKNIHFGNNGTFTLGIEKFRSFMYMSQRSTQSGGSITRFSYYYFGSDVLVANFRESDASLNWIQKVPRKLYLKDNDIPSGRAGIAFSKDNSTKVFFNTMGKESFTDEGAPKKSELILISIDQNGQGEENRKVLHSAKNNKIIARPSELKSLNAGEIFMFGEKKSSSISFLKLKSGN